MAQSHETVDATAHSSEMFGDDWTFNDLASASSTEGRSGSTYDVFTELDPLGTGKIRPFVDKKDFFNDVRQKKRLLRELGDGEDSHPGSPRTHAGIIPTEVSTLVASSAMYSASGLAYTSSEALHLVSSSSMPYTFSDTLQHTATAPNTSTTPMHSAAIASHSFSESYSPTQDSYEEFHANQKQSTTSASEQQFEASAAITGFADFNR